jgi:hypothetical protein
MRWIFCTKVWIVSAEHIFIDYGTDIFGYPIVWLRIFARACNSAGVIATKDCLNGFSRCLEHEVAGFFVLCGSPRCKHRELRRSIFGYFDVGERPNHQAMRALCEYTSQDCWKHRWFLEAWGEFQARWGISLRWNAPSKIVGRVFSDTSTHEVCLEPEYVPHGVIAAEDCQENIIWCLKSMRWMIYQTVLITLVYARL